MTKRFNRDHIEIFHDYGVFVPNRTIVMDQPVDNVELEDVANTVSHPMANRLIKNLRILESISQDPVTIIMHTWGGEETVGMAIYDAIQTSKCHITMEVTGTAYSMGAILLQAADLRIMNPNASLMFHTGQATSGTYHPDEMIQAAQFTYRFGTERCDRVIYNRLLEKNPKLSYKKFRQMVISSRYMFADEAVALGLADEVKS